MSQSLIDRASVDSKILYSLQAKFKAKFKDRINSFKKKNNNNREKNNNNNKILSKFGLVKDFTG